MLADLLGQLRVSAAGEDLDAVCIHRTDGFWAYRLRGGHRVPLTYDLEYGSDTLEIHRDAIPKGCRALIVDDLLATGGTAKATTRLVEDLGGTVAGAAFVVELTFLGGRDKLNGYNVLSLIQYDK